MGAAYITNYDDDDVIVCTEDTLVAELQKFKATGKRLKSYDTEPPKVEVDAAALKALSASAPKAARDQFRADK